MSGEPKHTVVIVLSLVKSRHMQTILVTTLNVIGYSNDECSCRENMRTQF